VYNAIVLLLLTQSFPFPNIHPRLWRCGGRNSEEISWTFLRSKFVETHFPSSLSFPLVKRFNLEEALRATQKTTTLVTERHKGQFGFFVTHLLPYYSTNGSEYLLALLLLSSTLSLDDSIIRAHIAEFRYIHFCDLRVLSAPPSTTLGPLSKAYFTFMDFSVINLPLMNCAIKRMWALFFFSPHLRFTSAHFAAACLRVFSHHTIAAVCAVKWGHSSTSLRILFRPNIVRDDVECGGFRWRRCAREASLRGR